MTARQLNIKNRSYYFYNDLINILNFEASNLKLDKKNSLDLDTFYIGYVDKKPDWNVNNVNPLYLLINRIDGYFEKLNGVKYLKLLILLKIMMFLKNMIKYLLVLNHINKIDGSEIVYEKDYMKIEFLSDDDILL